MFNPKILSLSMTGYDLFYQMASFEMTDEFSGVLAVL